MSSCWPVASPKLPAATPKCRRAGSAGWSPAGCATRCARAWCRRAGAMPLACVGPRGWGELHLPEEMQVAAAHRQRIGAALEVHVSRLVGAAHHLGHLAQVDDDGTVHLHEGLGIELVDQFAD